MRQPALRFLEDGSGIRIIKRAKVRQPVLLPRGRKPQRRKGRK